MGKKTKKSTKKFQQRHKNNAGTGSHKKKHASTKRVKAAVQPGAAEPAAHAKSPEQLTVDELLNGAFLDGNLAPPTAAAPMAADDSADDSDADGDDEDMLDEAEELAEFDAAGASGEAAEESSSSDEDDPVVAQNRQFRSDIAQHKAEIDALAKQDPEFFAYLQQTDKELLQFGKWEEEDRDELAQPAEGEEDVELGDEEAGAEARPSTSGRQTITSAMADSWCRAAKQSASQGAMRQVLRAFRVACHFGDSEQEVHDSLRISSSAVFNRVLMFVLKEADGIFRQMLSLADRADISATDLKKSAKWKRVEPLVKSFLGNSLHLLGQMTEGVTLAFALRRLRASVPLLAPFDKLQRKFLKQALSVFGSAENAPRVQAILFMRAMAVQLPPPMLDSVLKGVYRSFVSNAKFVNAATSPHIAFMASCVVEVFGLDMGAAYEHAFTYIKQLAMLLRAALSMKTKDAFREVYCWQTVNCLELWAKVLAAHADKQELWPLVCPVVHLMSEVSRQAPPRLLPGIGKELRPLVYPVVQLLSGTVRLVPTQRYFPLRLRCVRALITLSQATGVFIPTSPLLLEMLKWGELSKAPRAAGGEGGSAVGLLARQLRVSKNTLRMRGFQEEIVMQVLEQLGAHLAQWSCHVAFPELAHLPLVQLRGFAKSCKVERFRTASCALADAIQRNAAWVAQGRDAVDFSPKDASQVAGFLRMECDSKQAPMQKYAQLLADKTEQRRVMASTEELNVGRRASLIDGASDSDEEPTERLGLDELQAADAEEEAEADEQEISEKLLPRKQTKHKPKPAAAAALGPADDMSDRDEDDEDRLEQYELSSDDEE